mmetsp:Transcript_4323/g.6354  ORF Transcript_4323/g.6354 Transcript_4323/m.6354 type:complete len:912 (-) Transcript_4323:57-2792(-)
MSEKEIKEETTTKVEKEVEEKENEDTKTTESKDTKSNDEQLNENNTTSHTDEKPLVKEEEKDIKEEDKMVDEENEENEEDIIIVNEKKKVLNLGRVEWEHPRFHDSSCIYPVGYHSQIQFASYLKPETETTYDCKIQSDGNSPLFIITAKDDPTHQIRDNSLHQVMKSLFEMFEDSSIGNSLPDPLDFFVLNHDDIRPKIENLPDADQCKDYIFISRLVRRQRKRVKYDKLDAEESGDEFEDIKPKKKKKKHTTDGTFKLDDAMEDDDDDEVMEELEELDEKNDSGDDGYYGDYDSGKRKKKRGRKGGKLNVLPPIYKGISPEDQITLLNSHQYRRLPCNMLNYDGDKHLRRILKEYSTMKYQQETFSYRRSAPTLKLKQLNSIVDKAIAFEKRNDEKKKGASLHDFQPQEIEATRDTYQKPSDRELIRAMWQFPYICYACYLLREKFTLYEFTPKKLENAFLNPADEDNDDFLADLHIRLVKSASAATSVLESNRNWFQIVKNKLDYIQNNSHVSWNRNPMKSKTYQELSPVWRVVLMKDIIDWRLGNQTPKFMEYIHELNRQKLLRIEPVGIKSDGTAIWYFGPSVGSIYEESNPNPEAEDEIDQIAGTFTIVAETLDGIKDYASKIKSDKACGADVHHFITKEIIPEITQYRREYDERKKERMEQRAIYKSKYKKKMERKRQEQEMRDASSSSDEPDDENYERSSSGRRVRRVSYKFEDEDDDGDEYEDESDKKKKKKEEDDDFVPEGAEDPEEDEIPDDGTFVPEEDLDSPQHEEQFSGDIAFTTGSDDHQREDQQNQFTIHNYQPQIQQQSDNPQFQQQLQQYQNNAYANQLSNVPQEQYFMNNFNSQNYMNQTLYNQMNNPQNLQQQALFNQMNNANQNLSQNTFQQYQYNNNNNNNNNNYMNYQ